MERYRFPPTNEDWRKLELNNNIALNILYIPHNTKKIQLAYRSKNNLTCDKQVILLMITDGEKWHYLVVKILSGLLKGIAVMILMKLLNSFLNHFYKDLKKTYKIR